MAESIIEIANREVFCLRPEQPAQEALDELRRLRIHGAPVVDPEGVPLGVVTMSDLVGDLRSVTVGRRMTQPADVVPAHAPIGQVARTLVEQGRHHTVVVNRGKVVGFVSSVDLLAALVGTAPVRPDTFPQEPNAWGLRWSEPLDLQLDRVGRVHRGSGLLVLIHGGAFRRERVVYVESVASVGARLEQLLSGDGELPQELEAWSGWGSLRFAYAVHDGSDEERHEIVERLRRWQTGGEARVHELLGSRSVGGDSPRCSP